MKYDMPFLMNILDKIAKRIWATARFLADSNKLILAFIGIMSVFWFIYLNGVTALLPLQKESNLLVTSVYVLLTILLIVLLQLKVSVKNRE
ncbi:hypothetical protein LGV83_02080 [Enterococcus durans]|uniref:hypothetical protein n=1 Tax=Enterococcus durans TaxID=53345 RepID=UPI001EDF837E|nr:hypothetical protein [Enterococcus durans]MCG3446847.1 hypothetical protein [Enterococcus durans]